MKKIPFTIFATIGLFFYWFIDIASIHYDGGGLNTIIFFVGEFFQIPFRIPQKVLFAFNDGVAVENDMLISIVVGFTICILLDVVIHLFRTKWLHSKSE